MWKRRQKALSIDDFGHPTGQSDVESEQAPLLRGSEGS